MTDFNHFAYELSRNPLGCLIHCIELLIKEKSEEEFKQRQWDAVCLVNKEKIGFELFNFDIYADNHVTGNGEGREGPFRITGRIL